MSEQLFTEPAIKLAEAIRAKEVSSREMLEGYVDRIDRLGGPINAVVTFDLDRARAAATAADDATIRDASTGPLHGLPITIKDAIETEGIRSTGGAAELAGHVPTADAPAVARLKTAGAIVFGKTNLPRWSGNLQTYNELFGTTNNPWAIDRTPGGKLRRRGRGGRVRLHQLRAGDRHRRVRAHAFSFLRRVRPEAELWPGAAAGISRPRWWRNHRR